MMFGKILQTLAREHKTLLSLRCGRHDDDDDESMCTL